MQNDVTSTLQFIANQLNAQKSTGPRTEAGKNAARFNARRHGLTGQFYCMSEGDEAAYNAFETNLLTDLKPATHYESQLAISIVQDQWRLNRSRGTEFNVYAQGGDEFGYELDAPSENVHAAHTMASKSQQSDRYFANIALYETRLHRIIVRNEKRLQELQAQRQATEATALREAELLTRLALMKGASPEEIDQQCRAEGVEVPEAARLIATKPRLPANIEVNGFVFSTAAILHSINRKDQLAEALFYERNHWSDKYPCPNPPPPVPKAA